MGWFTKRMNEASSWGGAGLFATAVGQGVATGQPLWLSVVLGLGGVAMMFKSDGDKGF